VVVQTSPHNPCRTQVWNKIGSCYNQVSQLCSHSLTDYNFNQTLLFPKKVGHGHKIKRHFMRVWNFLKLRARLVSHVIIVSALFWTFWTQGFVWTRVPKLRHVGLTSRSSLCHIIHLSVFFGSVRSSMQMFVPLFDEGLSWAPIFIFLLSQGS